MLLKDYIADSRFTWIFILHICQTIKVPPIRTENLRLDTNLDINVGI